MMPQDNADNPSRFFLRWRQNVPGGTRFWYIRRLSGDLRFWGYVHIRTAELSENRNFAGHIPDHVWHESIRMISLIRAGSDMGGIHSASSDGALLEGNADTGTQLICCNISDAATSEGARVFYGLVNLLEPLVSAAAFGGGSSV